MAEQLERQTAFGVGAARQLANATKTVPQMLRTTPRWLVPLLQTALTKTVDRRGLQVAVPGSRE
jgi:hypothetical protein